MTSFCDVFIIHSLAIWMILTAINESIWSLMLKELLLYTTSSPQVSVRPAMYYLKKKKHVRPGFRSSRNFIGHICSLFWLQNCFDFTSHFTSPPPPPPPHPWPPLSQSLLIFTGIYLKLLKTKRKGEKLKQGFRSSCLTAVRISSDRGKF